MGLDLQASERDATAQQAQRALQVSLDAASASSAELAERLAAECQRLTACQADLLRKRERKREWKAQCLAAEADVANLRVVLSSRDAALEALHQRLDGLKADTAVRAH